MGTHFPPPSEVTGAEGIPQQVLRPVMANAAMGPSRLQEELLSLCEMCSTMNLLNSCILMALSLSIFG